MTATEVEEVTDLDIDWESEPACENPLALLVQHRHMFEDPIRCPHPAEWVTISGCGHQRLECEPHHQAYLGFKGDWICVRCGRGVEASHWTWRRL